MLTIAFPAPSRQVCVRFVNLMPNPALNADAQPAALRAGRRSPVSLQR